MSSFDFPPIEKTVLLVSIQEHGNSRGLHTDYPGYFRYCIVLLHRLLWVVDVVNLSLPSKSQDFLLLEQQHPLSDALFYGFRFFFEQIHFLCAALLNEPLVIGHEISKALVVLWVDLEVVPSQLGLFVCPLLRWSLVLIHSYL